MSAISQKSISGITSITSPAGTDDQISLHTSNTNEALKIDGAGNLHLNNHVNTTGVTTASNFKTGSSNLHSTGLTVGDTFVHSTGVNASSLDVDDFVDVGNNIKLGNAGVITATSFVGDGSDLTNLPAGLGTALSSTQTNPLNKMYYTNQVLGIGATVTVDPPASAQAAYTQYADIKVDDDHDLIIAEGDDLIPDVLGLADFGNFGGGPSAGRIRVNSITNSAANGAPTVQNGLVISGIMTAQKSGVFGNTSDSFTALTITSSTSGISELRFADTTANAGYVKYQHSDNALILATNTSERLRITSDGKIGIGVENPSHFLHLKSASSPSIKLEDTTNTNILLVYAQDSDSHVGTYSNHPLVFDTNSTERLRITSAGMLSIGKTSNAGKAIEIYQNANAALRIQNSTTGTGANDGILIEAGASQALVWNYESTPLKFGTAGTERFQITSDGKVGVNCTPAGMLEVQTNGVPSIIANYNNSKHIQMGAGGSGAGFHLTDGHFFTINHQPYANRGSDANLTERFRIGSDGVATLKNKLIIDDGTNGHLFLNNTSSENTIHSGTTGFAAYKNLVINSNQTDFKIGNVLKMRVGNSYVIVHRENTSNEGGQIALTRASDDVALWHMDVYGSGSDPDFRIHANGASHFGINPSGQWVDAPTGTVIKVGYARYDPNSDSYSSIASNTKARSAAALDYTCQRTDSKLYIMTRMHTRMIAAYGCSYGIDYSTDSGSSWTTLDGMAQRNAMDFYYKNDGANHHYTGFCMREIGAYSGTRRFSPWGQGWSGGTWEISYGHCEHSITIYEVAV